MNERANAKICGATGFRRLAAVFVADVYVIRKRGFLPRGAGRRWRRTERGRGEKHKSTLAEYLTTSGALGRRRGPRCRGPKSRGTAKRRAERGQRPSRPASRARRFLRLTASRLAFYLGQTGIRLNALIKLLTSYGWPGGHRVSLRVRAGPFLPGSSALPFIFIPPLRTANQCSSYFTFDRG